MLFRKFHAPFGLIFVAVHDSFYRKMGKILRSSILRPVPWRSKIVNKSNHALQPYKHETSLYVMSTDTGINDNLIKGNIHRTEWLKMTKHEIGEWRIISVFLFGWRGLRDSSVIQACAVGKNQLLIFKNIIIYLLIILVKHNLIFCLFMG